MFIEAAVTRAKHAPMSLEILELQEPRADEILVRLVATGVCHTDIAMRDQAYPVPQPIVLGHEGAGIVERVGGSVTRVEPGDHVVMSYDSCGRCASCLANAATYCHGFFPHNFLGSRSDGSTALSREGESIHSHFFGQSSFATHAICRERNVVKVPEDIALELLGPLACSIQTGAGAVINALKIGTGRSFAVFGAGSVGLSAVMAARVAGATTIVAVDIKSQRLALARELGATHTIDASKEQPAEAIVALSGAGVDYTLETTALPHVIRQAVESLAPRGTCGIVGACPGGTEMTLDVLHIMTAGRTIRGIVEGDAVPQTFVATIIELYRQGRFPFDKLVTFYPFDRIDDAVRDSENGSVVKAVVRMGRG